MRSVLPSGTVTLVFTDIEGSTRLLHELGPEGYDAALVTHRRLLRDAFTRHDGVEVDNQGDAFFFAFPTAVGAVSAAVEGQEALKAGPIRVRMGMHTGTPHLGTEGYIGEDVNKGARIAAAGHGGQVLLSKDTREAVETEVTDLGEHRVKDFAEPVWIYQLGTERFPPLKTISNTNLPHPASSFVGREREIAEIARLVRGSRLVTLTGPGGSGKTRLAIEVASELVPEQRNGVFWVGLSALRDVALVAETVGQTIGASDGLADHIGEREMLILLDNFEQVVEAAPELTPLIERCPNLKILVTSRERLRIRGEVEYEVPPLARGEAVDLFCARATMEPDDTIAELCRRLDSLPLAVELAAARTTVLTPQQILDRLAQRLDLLKGGRDADARQATLRATIEWSHDLLAEDEKKLFARLSVFAGGSTLDAAEKVADAELDTLQSLVDKSLVRHTDDRFWMLETIREYAVSRLEHSGATNELRRRHATHLLALAEEAEPHFFSEKAHVWHARLERELDNVRAALDWFNASGETQSVLRLAGALGEFWAVQGHLMEGRRLIEEALDADRRPTKTRAVALNAAADLANGTGDPSTAERRAREGLALHRELGDAWSIADALYLLGIACNGQDEFAKALEFIEEGTRIYRDLGDERQELEGQRFLAAAHRRLGDVDRAMELMENNVRRARALGDRQIESRSLQGLAEYALDDERVREAVELLEQAFRLSREASDALGTAIIVCTFARALAGTSPARATCVLASGDTLLAEMGIRQGWLAKANRETSGTIRELLDADAYAKAWEQGRKLTAEEAVGLALSASEQEAR